MWVYSNVGNGTCKASRLLVTELLRWLKVEILMRGVEGHQSFDVVQMWSDMYRDHGGYISTGVKEVWSKEMDRYPLIVNPQVLHRFFHGYGSVYRILDPWQNPYLTCLPTHLPITPCHT
jgi:hypothetical protein